METRTIGSLRVPVVGVGCNHIGVTIDDAGTRALVDAAIESGVTLFDTADEYGVGKSEEQLGKALVGRRDKVIVASKFGIPFGGDAAKGGGSARWIAEAVEASLRRLGTDYIDLYQLHFPDPLTPIDETLTALDRLVRDGKVREFGCSNFTNELIDEAATAAAKSGTRMFASAQNELNLLRQQAVDNVLPACGRHGLGVLPYFPLASGMLTGKYQRGLPPPPGTRLADSPYLTPEISARMMSDKRFDRIEALDAFARSHRHTILELAMGWLLAQPAVACIIAGATKPEQIVANARAAAAWQLTSEEAGQAAAIARGEA